MKDIYKKISSHATALVLCVVVALTGACTDEHDALGYDPDGVVRITGLDVAVNGTVGTRADLGTTESIVVSELVAGETAVHITFSSRVNSSEVEFWAKYNTDGSWTFYSEDAYSHDTNTFDETKLLPDGIIVSKEVLGDKFMVSSWAYNTDPDRWAADYYHKDRLNAFTDFIYDDATGKFQTSDMFGSIRPSDGGYALSINYVHFYAYLTALLDGDFLSNHMVDSVGAVFVEYDGSFSYQKMHCHTATDANGAATNTWETFVSGSDLKEFRVYTDGSSTPVVVTVPSTEGKKYFATEVFSVPGPADDKGNSTVGGYEGMKVGTYHYPFRITLTEGKTSVKLDTENTLPGWTYGWTTESDVIRIYTAEQLAAIGGSYNSTSYPLNGSYVLMNNINMAEDWVDDNGNAKSMAPIGGSGAFNGKFNGNGHKITGLKVSGTGNAGLFRYIGKNGIVHNLHLVDVNITCEQEDGYANAAAIAGQNAGRIDLCSVSGSNSKVLLGAGVSDGYMGGIAGANTGTITRSWAIGITLDGGSKYEVYAGGIASRNTGTILASFAMGNNFSNMGDRARVGGLVSTTTDTLFGCYTKGNYSLHAGSTGTVTSCYDRNTTDFSNFDTFKYISDIAPITTDPVTGAIKVGSGKQWWASSIWQWSGNDKTVAPVINLDYNGATSGAS